MLLGERRRVRECVGPADAFSKRSCIILPGEKLRASSSRHETFDTWHPGGDFLSPVARSVFLSSGGERRIARAFDRRVRPISKHVRAREKIFARRPSLRRCPPPYDERAHHRAREGVPLFAFVRSVRYPSRCAHVASGTTSQRGASRPRRAPRRARSRLTPPSPPFALGALRHYNSLARHGGHLAVERRAQALRGVPPRAPHRAPRARGRDQVRPRV